MTSVPAITAIEKAHANLSQNPADKAAWVHFRRVLLMEAGRVQSLLTQFDDIMIANEGNQKAPQVR